MNILKEEVDALNAVLKLTIDKIDYEPKVEEVLKDYRRKAAIKGFRPGHAPVSLINKLYRKPIIVDEVNKLISESLSKYLVEQKLNILGEPLPSEQQKPIDWDTQENFEFAFDLGLTPEFELTLSKKDKIPYYTIKVDDKLREIYSNSYRQRNGNYKPVEITAENDLVKATLNELNDDESPKDGGIYVESASISIALVADEAEKAKLIGLKAGDVVTIDTSKAFPNATDKAALLHIAKDKLADVQPLFQATVTETMTFAKAELDQELFNKVYGEGVVNSIEEFNTKMDEEISKNLAHESDYRLLIDLKAKLIEKFKIELPKEFLIRWLVAVNEGKHTREQIESEFPMFEKDLSWQLIRDKVALENDLKITEEEVHTFAMNFARQQFASYGMSQMPDEYLANYADSVLKKDGEKRKIQEKLLEDKAVVIIREAIKLDEKEVTTDEFNNLK
ncbi:MAG: trigger factor [Bacteroidales bacterium]|nr:MAG: trigger factor [Bacteroidales bacterium]